MTNLGSPSLEYQLSYRIYMDICCLNRPFDDLEQERIRLEAEAILWILQRCQNRQWSLVNSNALEFELEKTSNREKVEQVASLLALAQTRINSDEGIEARVEVLIGMGFKFYDALHIAFAEAADVDVMLTTDDRLLRRALRCKGELKVTVENPIMWLTNVIQFTIEEGHDTN